MILAKVTKCPWPLAFKSDGLDLTVQLQKKNEKFQLFPLKCLGNQNWPCRKIGQGQPRVTICTKFVVLPTLMLHTKFQGNWPCGSGAEDFLRFWAFLSMAAILVIRPGPFIQTFVPPSQWGSTWNLALIGHAVSEEKMFEIVDHDADAHDGRRSMGKLYANHVSLLAQVS